MRVLITAGPTREPIDLVRYIGNRSSGRMGAAIAEVALAAGHAVTLVVGPVSTAMPAGSRRIDVESSRQMQAAVLTEFPRHDLLIMAAAVADYRPVGSHPQKLERGKPLTLELEPTDDIVAAAGLLKRPDQRTIGFALERDGDLQRAREKLVRKRLDLIVYNPPATMDSPDVDAVLLFANGQTESPGSMSKRQFADILLRRAVGLWQPD